MHKYVDLSVRFVLGSDALPQLLEIVKRQKKSPYVLISPYLSQIAPFVVARKCTSPMLIFETCRFISVHPRDFISATRSKTFPYLFANCEGKVIEEISIELEEKISSLFRSHPHETLVHTYLLQGPGQTNGALRFITKTLSDSTGNKITIRGLVKSFITQLVATLMVVGAENEERATLVWLHPYPCLVVPNA
jgi:serine/threonine-protein kinase ATR